MPCPVPFAFADWSVTHRLVEENWPLGWTSCPSHLYCCHWGIWNWQAKLPSALQKAGLDRKAEVFAEFRANLAPLRRSLSDKLAYLGALLSNVEVIVDR